MGHIQPNCTYINNEKSRLFGTDPSDLTTRRRWEHYLRSHGTAGVWAEYMFCVATANYIGLDIHINSATCTRNKPVNILRSYWQEPDVQRVITNFQHADMPYLLIGHHGNHFQSLLPRHQLLTSVIHQSNPINNKSGDMSNLRIKFPPLPVPKFGATNLNNLNRDLHLNSLEKKIAIDSPLSCGGIVSESNMTL